MIRKYGEVVGLEKWNSYREKQRYSNTLEYKQEKNGWSKEDFKQYNLSRAATLENMISRHGEEEGTIKWNDYCERQRYTTSVEYFIEREEDANIGLEKFQKYCIDRAKSQNVDFIKEKYNVSLDEACEILSKRKNSENFISNSEKIFVDGVEKLLEHEIKYTYKTRQFAIWSKSLNQICFYDICCTERMKILEFNGDYWHANPLKYSKTFIFQQSGKSAEEIWEHDYKKIFTAIERGFKVLTIWENEVINDYDAVLNRIKIFWNEQ